MENFPTVAALKEAVTVAEFEAKATRASLFPKIGVEARVGVDVSSDGMKKSGARIGPSISQTLSLGGGRKQRIMNAQLNLRVAQENLKEEYRLLNLAYRQATSDVSASRLRVVKRREILNLHIKSSQIMREEYELGNRSLRDLIDAEERIFNARTDLNEAYRDQLKDQLSLIKAVNRMSDKFYVAPS